MVECALTAAVRGEGTADQPHAWVRADPGTAVLRELVGDFRCGALTRTLRYTITALLAGLGRRHTHEFLDSYFTHHPPDGFPAVEADRFAGYLRARPALLTAVPYLEEVLTFEHALITATLFGTSSDVRFTADPTQILEALDHGSLPNNPTPTRSSIRVTAAGTS